MPLFAFNERFFVAADGTRLRYGLWEPPGAARGTVLLLQGRREFLEKYGEMIGEWQARGFAVVALDWRGQGGSDRPLSDRHKSHITDFRLYRDDLERFAQDVVAPFRRGPLWLCAHSMGACIGLDWVLETAPTLAGIILIAPMLTLPVPGWLFETTHLLASGMVHLGLGEHYIPGDHRYVAAEHPFEGNVLTHDPERYAVIRSAFEERPELALGGVTFRWVVAAMEAIDRVRAGLPRLSVPTLALLGGADPVLPAHDLSRWIERIPGVVEVTVPGALHDLIAETNERRGEVWRAIDVFLATQKTG